MGIEIHKNGSHIICPFLVILQFYICFASSIPIPIPIQESDHERSVDINMKTISLLPCSERYAMGPFFRLHDNIIDSNLQDYIEHKIASSADTMTSRLLVLERSLVGEGSHRRLSSSIRFSVQPNSPADFSSQICEVIIIERLPSGVFADPFELDHILNRGGFKDASVFGDINLELPSFLSNRSIVEIHLDAALNISSEGEIVKQFKLEIPLHARYPALDESGYTTVKFGVPDLFFRCKTEASPAQTCLITPISGYDGLKVNYVNWDIPAGIEAHAGTVSAVTFTAALLSVFLIAVASFKHTRAEPGNRLKKS